MHGLNAEQEEDVRHIQRAGEHLEGVIAGAAWAWGWRSATNSPAAWAAA